MPLGDAQEEQASPSGLHKRAEKQRAPLSLNLVQLHKTLLKPRPTSGSRLEAVWLTPLMSSQDRTQADPAAPARPLLVVEQWEKERSGGLCTDSQTHSPEGAPSSAHGFQVRTHTGGVVGACWAGL